MIIHDYQIINRIFKVEPLVRVKTYLHGDDFYYELSPGMTYHDYQIEIHEFCAVCDLNGKEDCKRIPDFKECKERYRIFKGGKNG